MLGEFGQRASDHVVTIIGSFPRPLLDIGNVLYRPWPALDTLPKSTLAYCNLNCGAALENEVVSLRPRCVVF